MRKEYRDFLRALSWSADAVRKWALVTIAMAVAFVISCFVQGCAAVQPTCMVIDAAHAACAVITYYDASGKQHAVKLSPEDLASIGRSVEAQRSAGKK